MKQLGSAGWLVAGVVALVAAGLAVDDLDQRESVASLEQELALAKEDVRPERGERGGRERGDEARPERPPRKGPDDKAHGGGPDGSEKSRDPAARAERQAQRREQVLEELDAWCEEGEVDDPTRDELETIVLGNLDTLQEIFRMAEADELEPEAVRERMQAAREDMEDRLVEVLGEDEAADLMVSLSGPWSRR